MTVARMFFSNSPAWNRELYEAMQQQMQRDYSPTYWFRILRAEQLLALYRRDPAEFAASSQEYKSEFVTARRAPHRLSVWLKKRRPGVSQRRRYPRRPRQEAGQGAEPARLFRLLPLQPAADLESLREASPSALGTLTYIAFETRRLFEEMDAKGRSSSPSK